MNKKNISGSFLFLLLLSSLLSGCSPYFNQVKFNKPGQQQEKLALIIQENYPFTSHKNINWDLFSSETYSSLAESRPTKQDYLGVRDLVFRIPDARVNISWRKDKSLRKLETAGYLGFDIAYSPVDQFFVCRIDSQSDAWEKGIRVGNGIIGWDRKLISETISSFPLRWGYHPATPELTKLMACHYLCRGTPGSSVEVFYVNDQENSKGIRIEYVKKQIEPLPGYVEVIGKESRKKFEFSRLNDSLGYFRLDQFTLSGMRFFRKNILPCFDSLSSIIIDLRNNTGGYDPIAVSIASHFVTKKRYYEESFIKEGSELHTLGVLEAEPDSIQFLGRMIILSGPMTMGVAEGFINILEKEDHVKLLGSWNTAGGFSLPGGKIKLGYGIRLYYPVGGSMDTEHNIIIESGAVGDKGIKPDILIPPTKELIIQMANGIDVLLMEAVYHIWVE